MKDLTSQQSKVYHFLQCFIKEKKYPPTCREIGEEFNFSTRAAHEYLKALKRKGFIRTVPRCCRTISIVKRSV